jgi:hypothetical protein
VVLLIEPSTKGLERLSRHVLAIPCSPVSLGREVEGAGSLGHFDDQVMPQLLFFPPALSACCYASDSPRSEENAPREKRIEFRIGINLDDVRWSSPRKASVILSPKLA